MRQLLPRLMVTDARRGGALIVSILMLVAMTGLGIVSVTASRMEATIASNFKTLKQAQYLAEAGLIAASARIQDDPASFASIIKRSGCEAFEWDSHDFGRDGVFVTPDDQGKDRSMGFDARPIDFQVRVEDVQDLPVCPGYAMGTMCCLKVSLVSEGRIGFFGENDVPLEGTDGARRRVRAEYAVPYPCPR